MARRTDTEKQAHRKVIAEISDERKLVFIPAEYGGPTWVSAGALESEADVRDVFLAQTIALEDEYVGSDCGVDADDEGYAYF